MKSSINTAWYKLHNLRRGPGHHIMNSIAVNGTEYRRQIDRIPQRCRFLNDMEDMLELVRPADLKGRSRFGATPLRVVMNDHAVLLERHRVL